MSLNKQELFERIRMLWPDVIELKSEGFSTTSVPQLLNKIYRQIESEIDKDDHWTQIAIWAYYQSISEISVTKGFKVYPREVDFFEFDRMMIQNLKGDECWEHEKRIYLDGTE
jgi:long-subunit acyl-CoA synthetase (AMP-forming)